MAKLTKDQEAILKALENEFLKINENAKPITSGLIDIVGMKQQAIEKENFIKECEAEVSAFKRIVHKAVIADAEKLRADLFELGLDVSYRKDGYCAHGFHIVDRDDITKQLMWISYDNHETVRKEKLGIGRYIPKSYYLKYSHGHFSYNYIKAFTIEELVNKVEFKNDLQKYYESKLKS